MLIKDSYIDFDKTAESGQCFRWRKLDDGRWEVPVENHIAIFRRVDEEHIEIESDFSDETYWRTYLGLDRDYDAMISKLEREGAGELRKAYSFSKGITILNQPFFETCISFLISQNNNIPRIKKIIFDICEAFEGRFPNAKELGDELSEQSFGLGYRQSYISMFCRSWIHGKLDTLAKQAPLNKHIVNSEKLPLFDILYELQSFRGIGPKVAACIALFSLGHIDCVPRDVWIKRAEETYEIKWDNEYAGFQQQLVFFWQIKHQAD